MSLLILTTCSILMQLWGIGQKRVPACAGRLWKVSLNSWTLVEVSRLPACSRTCFIINIAAIIYFCLYYLTGSHDLISTTATQKNCMVTWYLRSQSSRFLKDVLWFRFTLALASTSDLACILRTFHEAIVEMNQKLFKSIKSNNTLRNP